MLAGVDEGWGRSLHTLERASTSSTRRTSNRSACPSACLWRVITSLALSFVMASDGFHPEGSSSKARRSALLVCVCSVALAHLGALASGRVPSGRFRGRPLSMMLDDSEPPLRCPSVLPVLLLSSLEPLKASQGRGEALWSTRGADIGVGRVEVVVSVVVADRGLAMSGVVVGVGRPTLGVLASGLADRG